MHYQFHTQFGYQTLSSSEDILQTKLDTLTQRDMVIPNLIINIIFTLIQQIGVTKPECSL